MKIVVLRPDGKVFAWHEPHQSDLVLSLDAYAAFDVVRTSARIELGKPLPEGSDFEVVREASAGAS